MASCTIDRDKVLKAYKEACPDGKSILKTLFPETIEEAKYFDFKDYSTEKNILVPEMHKTFGDYGDAMQIRAAGEYKRKAIWLNSAIDWRIEKDSLGSIVLIPTKRDR